MHPETRRLAIRLGLSLTAAWAVAVAACFGFYFGLSAILRHIGHDRPTPSIEQFMHRLHDHGPAAAGKADPAGLPAQ